MQLIWAPRLLGRQVDIFNDVWRNFVYWARSAAQVSDIAPSAIEYINFVINGNLLLLVTYAVIFLIILSKLFAKQSLIRSILQGLIFTSSLILAAAAMAIQLVLIPRALGRQTDGFARFWSEAIYYLRSAVDGWSYGPTIVEFFNLTITGSILLLVIYGLIIRLSLSLLTYAVFEKR